MRALAPIPLPREGRVQRRRQSRLARGEEPAPGEYLWRPVVPGWMRGDAVETVLDALDWASLEFTSTLRLPAVPSLLVLRPETCKRVAAMYGY